MREARAVHLRSLGLTYEEIAATVLPCPDHAPTARPGCPQCLPLYRDRSAAHKAVARALEREYDVTSEGARALKQQQLAQIALLLRTAMRAAIGGNWVAMREARHLLDRRARLLGLDAPQRHVVTTELDAEIEAMMDQLAEAERKAAEQDA